jgi:hypothetical protein
VYKGRRFQYTETLNSDNLHKFRYEHKKITTYPLVTCLILIRSELIAIFRLLLTLIRIISFKQKSKVSQAVSGDDFNHNSSAEYLRLYHTQSPWKLQIVSKKRDILHKQK